MAEWFKAHAWKVCIRQKRIEGSNPSLSARNKKGPSRGAFFVSDEESWRGEPSGSIKRESVLDAGLPGAPQG